jgi:cell division protein ZapA
MEAGAERKTVRVTIFNQSYSLAASSDPHEVAELAHSVDDLMTMIAQQAGNIDSQRIAVLACLHMADKLRTLERELAALKERVDAKTREFTLLLDRVID